ncbi:MAG: hypothetical protein NTU44_06260 [Bacteroidetes bacterium]|nr:hypothetical protein [Bacteroidota bacterium]
MASSANITDSYNNVTGSDVTITYTVTPIATNTCSGNTFTVSVTVKSEPVASNGTASTCSDVAMNYNLVNQVTVLQSGITFTYTVTSSDPTHVPAGPNRTIASNANITDSYNNTTGVNVTITYTVTPIATNTCSGNTFTVIVTVKSEPVASNGTASTCSDIALNFNLVNLVTVQQSGITFTYTATSSDPTHVPAGPNRTVASSANITDSYNNTTGSDVTITYTVTPIATNTCSGNTFTVTVTVKSEPVASNGSVSTCSDVALNYNLVNQVTILQSGITFTYTVISSNQGQVPAGPNRTIASNANINDSYNNTTGSDVTITYTITPIASNTCSGNTFTVTVTVKSEPVAIDRTEIYCFSKTLNVDLVNQVTVGQTGVKFTYTVASSNPAVTPGPNRTVASNANITDSYTNNTNVDVTITYSVTPIGSNNCSGNIFTITVILRSKPVGANGTITICSNNALNYSILSLLTTSPPGVVFTYTVASSDPSHVPAGPNRTLASNNNIPDSYINNTGVNVTITYTITPINDICTGSTFTFTVTVKSEPVGSNGTATTCSDNALNFNLVSQVTVLQSGITFTYTVQSSNQSQVPAGPNRTIATNANITDTYTNTTGSDVTITYTVTPIASNTCSGNTFSVVITVKSEPVGSNGIASICSDETLNFSLVNLVSVLQLGVTFTYTVGSSDPTHVAPGPNRTIASNANITDTYTNTTGIDVTITYTVIPKASNGCFGNTFTVTVTVKSEPVATNGSTSSCSDVALNYSLVNLVSVLQSGVTFTYTVASSDPTHVAPGPNRTVASNSNITDTYTNTTGNDVTITYTVTPKASNGCFGNTFTVIVTIKSEPVGSNGSAITCSDVAINYSLVNLVSILQSGVTFTYTVASSDPTHVAPGPNRTIASNANITDTYTNTTGNDVQITYTVTPKASNACSGNNFSVVVTVKSEPVAANGTAITCSDVSLNFSLVNLVSVLQLGVTFTYTVASSDPTHVPPGPVRVTPSNSNIPDTYTNKTGSDVTITYTVTPIASNGCSGNPFTVMITVKSEPVANNGSFSTCSDAPLNLSLLNQVSILQAGATFTYTVTSSDQTNVHAGPARTTASGANITDNYTNMTCNDVTITYTVTPIGQNGCHGDPFAVTVTVKWEPKANNGNGGNCSDIPMNFNLVNQVEPCQQPGVTFTYTVTSNDQTNVPAGSPRTIASNANITDSYHNVTGSDVTITYSVTPHGLNGCTGDVFFVYLNIVSKPVANNGIASICSDVELNYNLLNQIVGDSNQVTFTYTVTSSDPVNVPPAPNQTNPSDSITNIIHTYTNTTGNNVTITYTVTPYKFSCAGVPFTVLITVKSEPVASSGTQSVCSGETLNYNLVNQVTVLQSGVTFTYTVTSSDPTHVPAGPNRTVASNANITDTYTNTTGINVALTYTIIPLATNGCTGNTFTVVITVKSEPTGTNTNLTVCSAIQVNAALQPMISNNMLNCSFKWWAIPNGSVSGESTTPQFTSTISDILSCNNSPGTVIYKVIPTGNNGCAGDTFEVTVVVNPVPIVNTIAGDTVCVTEMVTRNFAGTATTFHWENSNTDVGLGTDGWGTGISFSATNSFYSLITGTITVTPYWESCSGTSTQFIIGVYPKPVMNNPTSNSPVCNGDTVHVSGFTSQVAGVTYTWTNDNTTIGLPASGNGNIPSFMAINNSTFTKTATINVTPHTAVCYTYGDPKTFSITVYPTPSVNPVSDQLICEGSSTSLVTLTGSVIGATYTWNNYPSIGFNTPTSGLNIPGFNVLYPPSYLYPLDSAKIIVEPVFNGCTGPTTFFYYIVQRKPTPSITGPDPVCKNGYWDIYKTNPYSDDHYIWDIDGSNNLISSDPTRDSIVVHWGTNDLYTIHLTESTVSLPQCKTTVFKEVSTSNGTAPDMITLELAGTNTLLCPGPPFYPSYTWVMQYKSPPYTSVSFATGDTNFHTFATFDTINYYYYVIYSNGGPCGTRAYFINPFVINGTDEPQDQNTVLLYPNPNNGSFQLQIFSRYEGNLKILIRDGTGRLIKEFGASKHSNAFTGFYQLPDVTKGFYLVEVYSGNQKITTRKMIIH